MEGHFDQRAPEYDEWWLGTGRFASPDRPGWEEEREQLTALLAALRPARTLDVACGTGYLTQHLPGEVTGLDESGPMLAVASARLPDVAFVEADALRLPFADGAFERVFTSHFFHHLDEVGRTRFLAEARRVASELVVVDAAPNEDDHGHRPGHMRFLDADGLAAELGGGEVLHAGRWFVAVRA